MARARFFEVAVDLRGRPIPSVLVMVYQPGTTTVITETIYAAVTGPATLTNPLSGNVQGEIEFFLELPKRVDLWWSGAGFTETHAADVIWAEETATSVAAEMAARIAADALLIPLVQKGAPGGVATLDGATTVPDAQIPAAIARDVEVTAAVSTHAASPTAHSGTYVALFDVTKYGATGNGTTDDTVAINSAVAATAAAGGGIVWFPNGIYKITSMITVSSDNIELRGGGSAVISAATLSPLSYAIRGIGALTSAVTTVTTSITRAATNITVVSSAGLSVGDLIVIRSSSEVFNQDRPTEYIKGELAFIMSIAGTAVILESPTFDSYDTSGNSVTIDRIVPIRNFKLSNLDVVMGGVGLSHQGIAAYYFRNAVVENCRVRSSERTGVELFVGFQGIVRGCRVDLSNESGIGYGIQVNGVEQVLVTGNHGHQNRHSIDVDGGAGASPPKPISRNVVVEGNTATDDVAAGVSTHGGCEYVTLKANRIDRCGGGIIARGGQLTIEDNQITTAKITSSENQMGIFLGDSGAHPWGNGLAGTRLVLANNHVRCLGGYTTESVHGIYATAPLVDAVISNNVISGFPAHGMFFQGFAGRDSIIAENVVDCTGQSPGKNGIYFQPGTASTTSNNIGLLIRGNHILSPTSAAVKIEGTTDNFAPSADIIVDGNTLRSYTTGVDVATGFFTRVVVQNNICPTNANLSSLFSYIPANHTVAPALLNNVLAGVLYSAARDTADASFKLSGTLPGISFRAAGVIQTQVISDIGSNKILYLDGRLINRDAVNGGNSMIDANPTVGVTISYTGGKVGFLGTTPVTKPTVTGSKNGSPALASVLTQLASLGLITDSSITGIPLGVPLLRTALYYRTVPTNSLGTGTLTAGNLRVTPFYVPQAVTLSRIGAEVTAAGDAGRSVSDMVTNGTTTITSVTAAFVSTDQGRKVTGTNIPAGTYISSITNSTTAVLSGAATGSGSGGSLTISGCVVRLGIYNDDGTGYPGLLLLDAATIDGNLATVQEITISQALTAGLYWIGAVAQGVTTTQPTMRVLGTNTIMTGNPSIPGAAQTWFGYQQGSVTVALPSPSFSSSVIISGLAPMTFVKIGSVP